MAWDDNMLIPLRILLNDPSAETYTDKNLQQLLVTAAKVVQQEGVFTTTYSFDYMTPSISPDPSSDEPFTTLVVMKSFCLTNQWTYNQKVIVDGIKAKCGPVSMEQRLGSTTLTSLLNEGPCKTYEQMMKQHNMGRSNLFRGILTPFTHEDYEGHRSSHIRNIN